MNIIDIIIIYSTSLFLPNFFTIKTFLIITLMIIYILDKYQDSIFTIIRTICYSFLLSFYFPEELLFNVIFLCIILITIRFGEIFTTDTKNIQNIMWELSIDPLFIKDKNLKYILVNSSFLNFYNFKKTDIIGMQDHEIYSDKVADKIREGDLFIIETKKSQTIFDIATINNQKRYFMTIKQPIFDKLGRFNGIFGITRDITELELAKRKSEESKELLENILSFAPDPIFVKDRNGVYVKVNKAFADYHKTTPEEIHGKTDYDLFSDVLAEKFRKNDKYVFETGKQLIDQHVTQVHGKTARTIDTKGPIRDIDGNINYIIGIVIDITNFASLQDKYIENQKMDSITNFTAGIAHDLNNLLSGILGYGSLLREKELDKEDKEYLDNLIKASRQSTQLINKLMLFTKQYQTELDSVDLNEIILNISNIFKPNDEKKIDIILNLKDLKRLTADWSEINQIVMNLLSNAIEAIDEEGSVTISTNMVEIHDFLKFKYLPEKLEPGFFAHLQIKDTGVGIPNELQGKIFEPFFTTKATFSRKGIGLGLSIVYGVVTKLHGMINLESDVNKGTTIDVYLPVNQKQSTSNKKTSENIIRGKGTILCIDDEKVIQKMLGIILPKIGYEIIHAMDGLEGINIYKERMDEIACILLDLNMPGMNGRETFYELKKINPDVRVIISSGYGKQVDFGELQKDGIKKVLSKPYTIKEISSVLDEVIKA